MPGTWQSGGSQDSGTTTGAREGGTALGDRQQIALRRADARTVSGTKLGSADLSACDHLNLNTDWMTFPPETLYYDRCIGRILIFHEYLIEYVVAYPFELINVLGTNNKCCHLNDITHRKTHAI